MKLSTIAQNFFIDRRDKSSLDFSAHKESQYPSFNIWGTCTMRDTFTLSHHLHNYKINQFIQNNPPTVQFTNKFSEVTGFSLEELDFSNTAPAWKTWAILNAEKKCFTVIKDNKSDYLLLNLSECFYNFYEISNGTDITWLSNSQGIIKNNIISHEKLSTFSIKKINPLSIDIHNIYTSIDNFCDAIKREYSADRIILVEIFPSRKYISRRGKMHNFKNANYKSICNFIKKINIRFKYNIKHCICIPVPSNIICSEQHIWGLNNQHFSKDVYNYLGKMIHMYISKKYKFKFFSWYYLLKYRITLTIMKIFLYF